MRCTREVLVSMQRDFNVPGRSATIASNGMVATAHPLASLTALDILRRDGNACDAAIAAVAMLSVVEPAMTGIGGDCFALYSKKGGLPAALNGSGRAPAKAYPEWYAEHGIQQILNLTAHAVTIPGAVDAWCTLNSAYGTLPLADLLEPAARVAEEGYLVTPRVAYDWFLYQQRLQDPITAKLFLPGGRLPLPGDRMSNPPLAKTLRRIGREGRDGFYTGPVMRDIVARLQVLGGLHEEEDFAAQKSDWVEPITARYRDFDVYECPPNGHGLAALLILRILDGYSMGNEEFGEADRLHLFAEATRAAYAVRDAFICDPEHAPVDTARFLSDAWAEEARGQIRLDRATQTTASIGNEHKNTTYLCVVDRDGNAMSLINSLFFSFGSGILAPESGVLLHNRGSGFQLIAGHPNAIAPRKRPLHTIIPGMLCNEGRAVMPFGIVGGHYQAAGHAHFLHRMLDCGMDPQQAAEAPRCFANPRGVLELEPANPEPVIAELACRGHSIEIANPPLGGCQAIWIDNQRGVLIGGADPRNDGIAIGY
jgi:gamma-glutamyltranspeptidase / glutathione hydrolase